uniref:hypothetical protein n=1 Tax=Streptomyces europaeiscabiei TaxID=146819 RepID=UPI0038F7D177
PDGKLQGQYGGCDRVEPDKRLKIFCSDKHAYDLSPFTMISYIYSNTFMNRQRRLVRRRKMILKGCHASLHIV